MPERPFTIAPANVARGRELMSQFGALVEQRTRLLTTHPVDWPAFARNVDHLASAGYAMWGWMIGVLGSAPDSAPAEVSIDEAVQRG